MCPHQVNLYQCSCCDYFTLEVRNDWEICPVCFWEDDGSNVSNPDAPSGCNNLTLRQARHNFRRVGACEDAMVAHVCSAEERMQYRCEPRELARR
jgi:hypothetical protein